VVIDDAGNTVLLLVGFLVVLPVGFPVVIANAGNTVVIAAMGFPELFNGTFHGYSLAHVYPDLRTYRVKNTINLRGNNV